MRLRGVSVERAQLKARKRDEVTKRTTKALRREGYIPATMFGRALVSVSLGVPRQQFLQLLKQHGGDYAGILVDLEVEGDSATQTVLIQKAYQNPVTREYDNLDLHIVRMDEPVHVVVPVRTDGEPIGVHEGGLLEHVRREVEVRCLPDRIPEHLHVDVSDVHIGSAVTVADIRPLPGVEILTHADEMLAAVRPKPKVVEEAAPAAPEAAEAEAAASEEGAEAKQPPA
jgi:large subunit ribosomal protein L25